MCIHHIFFIHLLMDEDRLFAFLGYCELCYSKVACGNVSGTEVSFPFDRHPLVGLLHHRGVSCLVLSGTSLLVFTAATIIYILTSCVKWFPFLHVLSSNCMNNIPVYITFIYPLIDNTGELICWPQ